MVDTEKVPHIDLAKVRLASSRNAVSKSTRSRSSRSSCCALKVEHPADVIQIFRADDSDVYTGMNKTKFWTGSQVEEDLLRQGSHILLEIRNKSNLIFENREFAAENADNPKLLIPIHIAQRIGFTRLAGIGSVIQKTAFCTFTMQKVNSKEACAGSTALHVGNEIFKLDTEYHDMDANERSLTAGYSDTYWTKILQLPGHAFWALFSFRTLLVMLAGRYGLSLANEKYKLLEQDWVKLWMEDVHEVLTNYFYSMDKSPSWYEALWR